MPIPRIVLTAPQREDLAATLGVGAEKLARIASRIEGNKPTIQRKFIDSIINEEVGDGLGSVISRFVFGIAGPLRREIATADEILDGISSAIERGFKEDSRFKDWHKCRSVLSQLFRLPSINLAAKALDISYDFERVYAGGRFLTSVRPVYDDTKDDIVGCTIVQTLRLEYLSATGEQTSLSIALDIDDIRRLQTACGEALEKAQVAKNKFEGNYGLETIMPGGGTS